jgi:putative restriction endonuclease
MKTIRSEIIDQLKALRAWKRGGQRAPHKPLLLLLALARLSRGEPRLFAYADAEEKMRDLLREFGPDRVTLHPEHPFWHLRSSGLWEFQWGREEKSQGAAVRESPGSYSPSPRSLRDGEATVGFAPEVQAALEMDPRLLREAAELLLVEHFAESTFDDLLETLGFQMPEDGMWVFRVPRDPTFRPRVLAAYRHTCAVCGFDLRVDQAVVGLDAAHIRWKRALGPDHESNGLALCTVHHRLFDRGAFTIDNDFRLLVSERVEGGGLGPALLRFHTTTVRAPEDPSHTPAPQHLNWHEREVFRGPARGENERG